MAKDTVKSILSVASRPTNESELVDKKRITAKQALFIRNMCDEISNFLERHPLVFTEARAHRLIEALKPSWEVIRAHHKESNRITGILKYGEEGQDLEDFYDEDEGPFFGDPSDIGW